MRWFRLPVFSRNLRDPFFFFSLVWPIFSKAASFHYLIQFSEHHVIIADIHNSRAAKSIVSLWQKIPDTKLSHVTSDDGNYFSLSFSLYISKRICPKHHCDWPTGSSGVGMCQTYNTICFFSDRIMIYDLITILSPVGFYDNSSKTFTVVASMSVMFSTFSPQDSSMSIRPCAMSLVLWEECCLQTGTA